MTKTLKKLCIPKIIKEREIWTPRPIPLWTPNNIYPPTYLLLQMKISATPQTIRILKSAQLSDFSDVNKNNERFKAQIHIL